MGLVAKEGEAIAAGTRGKGRGTLGMGLAAVPVAVDTANEEEEPSFWKKSTARLW